MSRRYLHFWDLCISQNTLPFLAPASPDLQEFSQSRLACFDMQIISDIFKGEVINC